MRSALFVALALAIAACGKDTSSAPGSTAPGAPTAARATNRAERMPVP